MRPFFWAVGAMTVLASTPLAARTITCDLVSESRYRLIPARVQIDIVQLNGADDIRISDDILQKTLGTWVRGRIREESTQRIIYAWDLEAGELPKVDATLQKNVPKYIFSLTIQKANGAAKITFVDQASPYGMATGSGRGKCNLGKP